MVAKRQSVIAAACLLLASCDPLLELDHREVHFTGVVKAAATGQPIAGATVSLDQLLFVFQGTVVSDTTDALGRYEINRELTCEKGTDLYEAPGKAFILIARMTGYESQSTVNSDQTIRCISDVQTINFNLKPPLSF